MKNFTPNSYENLIPGIMLSYSEIERRIKSYGLIFPPIRNQAVEWGMEFPMFVPSFYDFVISKKDIPTQNCFWEHYLHLNKSWFIENRLNNDLMEGLKARVYRTYPSLVRDVHFSKYCTEKLDTTVVIYNHHLDIEEGIDVAVIHNGKNYAINLFTQTYIGLQGRQKKAFRHNSFDNMQYVELPVNFRGCEQCGNFFLYGEKELSKLKTIIGIL